MRRAVGAACGELATDLIINSPAFDRAFSTNSKVRRIRTAPNIAASKRPKTQPQIYHPQIPLSRMTAKPPIQSRNTVETPGRQYKSNGYDYDRLQTAIKPKSEIIVIHKCTVYRDCFVRCLEVAYSTHQISSYDSVGTWNEATRDGLSSPDAIVFFMHGNKATLVVDLRTLEAAARPAPIIVLSDNEDPDQISHIIKNGVRGYIPTSLPFNLAVEAVRYIVAGGTFVPASGVHLDRSVARFKDGLAFTKRQTMVVEDLCKGMANKQIAYHLGISEVTVKLHRGNVMRKMQAASIGELIRTWETLPAPMRETA